ncbi:MAG: hypothetical protein AB7S80_04465 [Rhizobiaceae bacterium]
MSIKLLSTAAIALSLLGAPVAFAQNDDAGASANVGSSDSMTTESTSSGWTDADRAFYDTNRAAFGGFFTDDSMSTPRSAAEMDTAWGAMSAENQAAVAAACAGISADRGKYSAFTTELCTKYGS